MRILLAALLAGSIAWNAPAHGKHIVLVAADDEYRSEEALPQLAKILAVRHGFTCTVLFAINPKDGTIDPHEMRNIPGLEALKKADLLIIFARFRDLPDDQMKYLADYIESGKPIIGIRTTTHSFDLKTSKTYAKYSWDSKIPDWEGGFGRRVLGETWIAHHGEHGKQSTRGIFARGQQTNPILRGIRDGEIWTRTDVYEVRLPLPATCRPLVLGAVLSGMSPNDPPVPGKPNDPMLPVAWTNTYKGGRVFTTTMGSAQDLENEGLRRLLVNAAYWAVGLEVPAKADVDLVGDYRPDPFSFTDYPKGLKPETSDESVWRAFRQWFDPLKLEGKPWELIESYRAELAREGVSKTETDRRMKIVWRLLWNTPEGVQTYWDKVYGSSHPIYVQRPSAFLVDAVAARKPGKALDFGMGQGRNAVFLALRGWDVTGFDPSDVAVRKAEQNAEKSGVKIHAVIAADDKFDFGVARWDLIVMTYVRDPTANDAARFWRALKPGGIFVYENGASENGAIRKAFAKFQILRYENAEGVADWNPDRKTQIEGLIARKASP